MKPLKPLFENWRRYVKEENPDVGKTAVPQLLEEQFLLQESALAMLAGQTLVRAFGSARGRRFIAGVLRFPGKLQAMILGPFFNAGRKYLEASDRTLSPKVLDLLTWYEENVGQMHPVSGLVNKLADLIEGLDDADAADVVDLVKDAKDTVEPGPHAEQPPETFEDDVIDV